MVECVEEGGRVLISRELADVHGISHRLNDARAIVLVVDDLRDVSAVDQGADVRLRRLCDQKMIVEDAGLDLSSIQADVQDEFRDIQTLIGEVFGDKSGFFEDVCTRGQDEAGIRGGADAPDEPRQIRILVG